MGQLDGRFAVVTAGTAGIGRAVAARFVAEGADVVVTSPHQVEIDDTIAELGPRVTGVLGDASDLVDHRSLDADAADALDDPPSVPGHAGAGRNTLGRVAQVVRAGERGGRDQTRRRKAEREDGSGSEGPLRGRHVE